MISNFGDFKIMRLQHNQIDKAAWLLAVQFTGFNQMWKQYEVPLEMAFDYFKHKIVTPNFQSESLVLLNKEDKIIGCIVQHEMTSYLNLPKPTNYENELFIKLQEIEEEQEKELQEQNFMRGQVMYSLYLCLDSSVQRTKIEYHFVQVAYILHHQKGVKKLYTRVTNPYSHRIIEGVNGQVVKSSMVDMSKDGTPVEIQLMYLDLTMPLTYMATL